MTAKITDYERVTDPLTLLSAAIHAIEGVSLWLSSDPDWHTTVEKARERTMVWDQVLFAQLLLDRVGLLMLGELSPGGWSPPQPETRRTIPRR